MGDVRRTTESVVKIQKKEIDNKFQLTFSYKIT
jgi:hypothetical protein